MKLGDLLLVEWEDSNGCPQGWQSVENCQSVPLATVHSVGWVTAVTEQGFCLTPHRATIPGQLDCVQGYISVPISGVLKKTYLLKKDGEDEGNH